MARSPSLLPEPHEPTDAFALDARADQEFLVLTVAASLIATLGLLANSAAVVIGAMLVAPWMLPLRAAAFAILQGRLRLVATALASCILTVMGIMAERHGWSLGGCSARVEKTMTSSGRRKIAKLEVWIHWPEGLEDRAKAVLQRAAEGCPVKESLAGAVAMELHWT